MRVLDLVRRAPLATRRRPGPGSAGRRRGTRRRSAHRATTGRTTRAPRRDRSATRCRACAPAARAARCRRWRRPCSRASPRRGRRGRSRARARDAGRGRRRSGSRDRTRGTRPSGLTHHGVGQVARDEVGQAWRVPRGDHVEVAVLVRLERVGDARAQRTSPAPRSRDGPRRASDRRSSTSCSSERSATRNAPETTCFPSSVHPSPIASIACRGCGPPSGRFITLMKYGAGAARRNSTVRSSSARTPTPVSSGVWPR